MIVIRQKIKKTAKAAGKMLKLFQDDIISVPVFGNYQSDSFG